MDPTLTQLVRALFEAHQEVDRLRESNRQLQAAYTDIKSQLEAKGAVPAKLH